MKEPTKRAAKKKCKHEIAAPQVIRLTHAIYERGECDVCGVRGQYVTSGKPEKTVWEEL